MVAKQTTRFIGYIICVPMALLILWQYRKLGGTDFTALFQNFPRLLNVLLYFLFVIGVGLSFHLQLIGGILVFLAPFSLFIIDCINAGHFVMPNAASTIMLSGSTFLLLTAQRKKD
jgi:hypothetical protein